jgi:hypothetical protein
MLDVRNIEALWPGIKNTALKSSGLPESLHERYALNVLQSLYSGLSQAWIGFDWVDGDKQLSTFLITALNEHPLTGVRALYIYGIFGYRPVTDEIAKDLDASMIAFAKSQNCDIIKCETKVSRVKAILDITGYTEDTTTYIKDLSSL